MVQSQIPLSLFSAPDRSGSDRLRWKGDLAARIACVTSRHGR
jgi:hypothetical protein